MRIVVVGAGVAGLVAARELAARHDVIVFDKGRSVGGRLATRRIGEATFDHGAQFFTVRGDALRTQTDDWLERGVARVWCHGFGDPPDGYPRYIGTRGMNSLAKDLAVGLDVRCNSFVFTLRRTGASWNVVIDDGAVYPADALVLTSPVPQSWALLAESGIDLPDGFVRSGYDRTIALLTVLDRPSAIPEPGAVQFGPHHPETVFSLIADNQLKGVSAVPAVTLHAAPAWSEANWDREVSDLRRLLLDAARPWIGEANVVEVQVKKWRFATPTAPWSDPCWFDAANRVVLAGDAFAGPKIEGAFDSGLAAAVAVDDFSPSVGW